MPSPYTLFIDRFVCRDALFVWKRALECGHLLSTTQNTLPLFVKSVSLAKCLERRGSAGLFSKSIYILDIGVDGFGRFQQDSCARALSLVRRRFVDGRSIVCDCKRFAL